MTMIVVTHEIGFARSVADEVVFMSEGELVEKGPPSQVIDAASTSPRDPSSPASSEVIKRRPSND
jgi:ABC-type polar amino acid transport system ATPase subunit